MLLVNRSPYASNFSQNGHGPLYSGGITQKLMLKYLFHLQILFAQVECFSHHVSDHFLLCIS